MKKTLILLFTLLFFAPGLVLADIVTVNVTYFVPRFGDPGDEYNLWQIEFDNMSFTKNNFHGTSLGFAYEYFFTRQMSLMLSLDTYSRRKTGFYKDYVGISFNEGDFAFPNEFIGDFNISHVFDVTITPIQLSLKLTPMGRTGRLIPYVGGGIGVYLWSVRLQGDIIDFMDVWEYEEPGLVIDVYMIKWKDAREENKVNIGFHALGGLMFPVGKQMSLNAEFKYNFVKGDMERGDDPFWPEGFTGASPFDLSGYQISIGFSYWF